MLKGATGESLSLIERSWRAAQGVAGIDRVVVATDDDRIRDAAQPSGPRCGQLRPPAATGPNAAPRRVANMGISPEIVVNLQGDASLTPAWFIEDLVAGCAPTRMAICSPAVLQTWRCAPICWPDRAAGRVGGTTAVFGAQMQGLYFSKEVILYAGRDFRPTRSPRSSTMSASTLTARHRWRSIPAGPRARWKSRWKGWNSCASLETAAASCASRSRPAAASSGS